MVAFILMLQMKYDDGCSYYRDIVYSFIVYQSFIYLYTLLNNIAIMNITLHIISWELQLLTKKILRSLNMHDTYKKLNENFHQRLRIVWRDEQDLLFIIQYCFLQWNLAVVTVLHIIIIIKQPRFNDDRIIVWWTFLCCG